MAEGGKPAGWFGGLAGLAQQWQVVVTAIAAATALWFGFAEQRRKQVEVNRAAVEAAKADRTADFSADPYATLAEFRVSYPEHAFCAALGLFSAEANRAAVAGGEAEAVRRMGDAVGAQVERIAAQGGLTLAALEAEATAAAGAGAGDACPDLRPDLGLRGRAMWEDCRVLVETYAQARCQARAGMARRAAVTAEIGGGAIRADAGAATWTKAAPVPAPGRIPAPAPAVKEPAPAVEPAPAPTDPGRIVFAPPGADCGPTPPLIYLQTPGDAAAAAPVAAALRAAGWIVPGIEGVKGGLARGDVRFYWPEQLGCARGLAGTLQAGTGREFATISLAGRYRNLPLDRMEVWLPGAQ